MRRRARALVVPRIVVTLELQTNWSVRSLRSAVWWRTLLAEVGALTKSGHTVRVLQAQANAIRAKR